MNRKEYETFAGKVRGMLLGFISEHKIPAVCKESHADDENEKWILNLGKKFGIARVSIESWENASYRGKVNVCTIPMRFETYTDEENVFSLPSGSFNRFNGKLVLHAHSNDAGRLLNDLKTVISVWSSTPTEEN